MNKRDFFADRWLRSFIGSRKLTRPDGRPLYRYRTKGDELASLQELLRGADLQHEVGRALSAAFSIFAAEMFRKEYRGGPWAWDIALRPLGLAGSANFCRQLAEVGLGWWGRPLRKDSERSVRYLSSIVIEGGFPSGLLERQFGAIRSWLMHLQEFTNTHDVDLDNISVFARNNSAPLPEIVRSPELFDLAAELVFAIKLLKIAVGSIDDSIDPILELQRVEPGWRERLPLIVEDDAARTLIRGLMRSANVRSEVADQFIHRTLIRDGEGWRASLGFAESGKFRRDQLPTDAKSLLDERAYRARLIAVDQLALIRDGEIAVVERQDEHWVFRSSWAVRDAPAFPFSENITVLLQSAGVASPTFVAPGGEAIAEDCLVFIENRDLGLSYVGSGSRSVRGDTLWVALDPTRISSVATNDSTFTFEGKVLGHALDLHRLRGRVELVTSDGIRICLTTGADDPKGNRVQVFPRCPPWQIHPAPVSLGMPGLFFAGGLNVAHRQVRWRTTRGAWVTLEEREPRGTVAVVVEQEKVVVDRFRATILPRDADVISEARGPGCGELRLIGFGSCGAAVATRKGLTTIIRNEGDEVAVSVEADSNVLELEITLSFTDGGPATLTLPVPSRGAVFIDRHGNRMRHDAPIPVSDLAGVRLLSDGHRLLSMELRPICSVSPALIDVSGLFPLSTRAPDCRTLLSESGDADARVVLSCDNTRIQVRRYAFSLVWKQEIEAFVAGPWLPSLPADARLRAVAFRLTDPQAGEAELWSGTPDQLAEMKLRTPAPDAPCIAWVEYGGRSLSRPAYFRSETAPSKDDDFAWCAGLPTLNARRTAMREHLLAISLNPDHPDWLRLRKALLMCRGRISIASLDWFPVLAEEPRALVAFLTGAPSDAVRAIIELDQELPFLWETIPGQVWVGAALARRSSLGELLGQAADGLVPGLMADTFDAVARERPHMSLLVCHLRALLGLPVELPGAPSQPNADPIQELLHRNLDGPRWPPLPELVTPEVKRQLAQYQQFTFGIIHAPVVAAEILHGRPADAAILNAVRIAKKFDPAYFESAFAIASRTTKKAR